MEAPELDVTGGGSGSQEVGTEEACHRGNPIQRGTRGHTVKVAQGWRVGRENLIDGTTSAHVPEVKGAAIGSAK